MKYSKKTIFKLLKIKTKGLQNIPKANYSTHYYLQNETSNNEIHQEVFQELHGKGGAM